MKLAGLTAVISGANQGLGLEIAREFVKEGANVMLCARNAEALHSAQKALSAIAPHGSKILARQTDIAKLDEVEAMIAETIQTFGKIDVLVANAGVYGPKGAIEAIDPDEWSDAIDINLKGTVWQCRAVVPHFKARQTGKIIILSGGGATKPMPFLSAYAASKAAIVRFAETLAEELKSDGITVNTIAPGALNTRLLDEILAAGPDKVGQAFYEQSVRQKQEGGTPLLVGASLCTFLASEESNGITGKLISAVWDPWIKFPEFIQHLQETDIYTLRRIIPKDRGQHWDENT